MKRLLVIFSLISLYFSAEATHLIGGYMSYEYLTTLTNGNLRYKITLYLYRDCFNAEVDLDDEILMGIYLNNAANDRYQTTTFRLIKKNEVDPPGTTLCDYYDKNVCVEQGFYEGTIDLPPSNLGYHVTFERCCRNVQDNITENSSGSPNQGQTYYAFIPDNLYENSSPVFSGIPSPYMCINDTTTFDFSAYDKDGDQLSYQLVHPYAGASLTQSAPDPGPNFTAIPLVNYSPGYNYINPFGAGNGSFATVDAKSGLTTFFATNVGSYVVAIEVTEKRNGVILSKVRMDLQILVLNCPPNDRPVVKALDGQDFTIEEGEPLCFDVEATDPNNDNVSLSVKGPIYDGSNGYSGPLATFQSTDGRGKATGTFCWTPDCNMDRTEPYFIRITAEDDGCPPKFNTMDFSITVTPFVGTEVILGPRTVCRYNLTSYEADNPSENSTFRWEADGGTIVGRSDTSVVKVFWDDPAAGKLRMTEISQYGCEGETTEIDITIQESPALPIITGKDTVCRDEIGLSYQTTVLNVGNSYEWFLDNGTIGTQNQNSMTIGTYALSGFTVKVVESNPTGCSSDTAKFDVFVSIPSPKIIGPQTICPNAQDIRYFVPDGSGSTFNWQTSGGSNVRTLNDSLYIDWGNEGAGFVQVVETNRYGCVSDPTTLIVNKTYTLDATPVDGPAEVCEFDAGVPYQTLEVNGTSYLWDVSGGAQVSGDSSAQISVDWGATGLGRIGVQNRSWDLVNARQCLSPFVYMDVTIHPRPTSDEINGPNELCQASDTFTYSVNGFVGSSFLWAIDGDTNAIQGQGTSTIKVYWDQAGTFDLSVIERSAAGCPGNLIDTSVLVNPKPNTGPITGPAALCTENVMGNVYSVTGSVNSNFEWILGGHENFIGQGTNSITVDWDSSLPFGTIYVLEVSDKGCAGDTQKLKVGIDRLALDMKVVTVGTPDNRVLIKWNYAVASATSEFRIQKREAGTIAWQNVATVGGNETSYLETPVNTDANSFEYRVLATNSCGKEVSTEYHTTILLTGYQDENFDSYLNFTDYLGWDNGVDYYTFYESINNGPYTPLTGVNPGDEILSPKINSEFKKCFRISAVELQDGNEISWSNEICFVFSPSVFAPNAITVNNDNLNDGFGIKTVAVKEVTIEVYNRWGELLWQTSDPTEHWDATYQGKDVPLGTYIYHIKYSDFEDKLYQKSGTINLIK